EVDAVLDGEGEDPEEAEPREGDGHREGRHAEQARQGLHVGDRDRLLLGADHRDGHDRRVGLEREAHEALAELLQLVALPDELVAAGGVGVEAPGVVAVGVEPRRDAQHALVDLVLKGVDRAWQRVRDGARERDDRCEHHQWRTLAKVSSRLKRGVKPAARWKASPSSTHGYLRKSIAPGGVWESPSRKRRPKTARATGSGSGTAVPPVARLATFRGTAPGPATLNTPCVPLCSASATASATSSSWMNCHIGLKPMMVGTQRCER